MDIIEEGTTEFKEIKKQREEEARAMTLENLPAFLRKLTEGYQHDYGTICHAMSTAAIAAAWAVDKSPSGGITGFQAGAVMWQFIREWNYSMNKTGLKIVDFDNFLYPQYEDTFKKTISSNTWNALQKEAAAKIQKADKEHAEYTVSFSLYEKAIVDFIEKYPDYNNRKEHYDVILGGNNEQWEAYEEKKASGFQFAPERPYEPINNHSPCFRHWRSIVDGVVPFGYSVSD